MISSACVFRTSPLHRSRSTTTPGRNQRAVRVDLTLTVSSHRQVHHPDSPLMPDDLDMLTQPAERDYQIQ